MKHRLYEIENNKTKKCSKCGTLPKEYYVIGFYGSTSEVFCPLCACKEISQNYWVSKIKGH